MAGHLVQEHQLACPSWLVHTGLMRAVGICLWALALLMYVSTVRAIWTMVRQSRQLDPGARVSLFWWLPAWRMHRRGYPASPVRRQIVTRFGLTFGLMLAGLAFIAVYSVRHMSTR